MKQKILKLLPRAGALLAALVVLISSVAVPAHAASTSEAVEYYDILDFGMAGTLTGGATSKEKFDVADYMSLYGVTYHYSSWKLLITGEFENVKLVSGYGASLYSSHVCSYQFTLTKDWFLDPSIKVQQENVALAGRYKITGAYLVNSTYANREAAYYKILSVPVSNSYLYNNVYNFESYSRALDIPAQGVNTVVFSPQQIVPCTSIYFEFEVEGLQPDDFSLSVLALSSSSAAAEIYDYKLTLISTTAGYYHYAVEAIGPFTDFVFVVISYTASDHSSSFYFDGFYVGYNRILNTNSLLEQIREQTTQIRSYLNKMRTRLDEIASNLADILQRIANGELGSKPATNIFDAWNGTISNLSNSFQSVVNAVNGIAGSVSKALASSFNSVTTAVNGIAGSVSNALASSFNSVTTAVNGIAGSVSNALASSFNSVTTAVSNVAGSVVDGLKSSIDSITTAVSSVAGSVVDGLKSSIDSITTSVENISVKLIDALIPDWQNSVFQIFESNSIFDFFTYSFDSVSGFFGLSDLISSGDSALSFLTSGLLFNRNDSADSSDNPFFEALDDDLVSPYFQIGMFDFQDFSADLVSYLPSNAVSSLTYIFSAFFVIGVLRLF